MIENKELIMDKEQQNTKTKAELNDFLWDAAETVVELAGEVTETVGEDATGGILEAIFDIFLDL
jgi:hypothetical protein